MNGPEPSARHAAEQDHRRALRRVRYAAKTLHTLTGTKATTAEDLSDASNTVRRAVVDLHAAEIALAKTTKENQS